MLHYRNLKKEITRNLDKADLCFFSNALFHVLCYLYFRFHINSLHIFKVMLWSFFKRELNLNNVLDRVMVLKLCTFSHCKKTARQV